jgi:DNA-binding PadR family transcriptional regulator
MLLREEIVEILKDLPNKKCYRNDIPNHLEKLHPGYHPSFSHLCYTINRMEAMGIIKQSYVRNTPVGRGNKVIVELVE